MHPQRIHLPWPALATAALLFGLATGPSPATAQPPLLDPVTHPKFQNELPRPTKIDAGKGQHFEMEMNETVQWLGLVDVDNADARLMTTVWGYGPAGSAVTYPGPTIVASKNTPITVTWNNSLPPYNHGFPGLGGHLLPVDPTLHLAHPVAGGIPTVTHLHGGHTESASDGLPEAWFTQGFAETGPQFVKQRYTYDNDQEAATLWYHDHALGITRLNVYAGLAGFYLLRDPNEMRLLRTNVLPQGPYEREIVIQDRMFAKDGQLFYPSEDPEIEPGFDPLPLGPSAIAEFFGDFIVVNGTAWPRLTVEPRKYRLRLLNGSDSRFYVLEFRNDAFGGTDQPFLQIGTDDGLLPMPVPLDRLKLGPGERADVVFDFSRFGDGTELFMRNFGPDEPFKGLDEDGNPSDGEGGALPPADPMTTGQIMKFVVEVPDYQLVGGIPPSGPNAADATVDVGTRLRPPIQPLKQKGATRQLVLFEGLDRYGRLQPLLGTLADGSLSWFQSITENPMLDDVEVWEIYNATPDAHPIHLHLVAFQILNRESFDGTVAEKPQPQHDGGEGVGGILTVNALGGDAQGPEPNENGWKDTAVMLPGQVTRLIAKFDRAGRYVWHCHILSHEDHEMMRPYEVRSRAAIALPAEPVAQDATPRLRARGTELMLTLGRAAPVGVKVFNVLGQEVRDLGRASYDAGAHAIRWDGRDVRGHEVPSGVYFYQVRLPETWLVAKAILLR